MTTTHLGINAYAPRPSSDAEVLQRYGYLVRRIAVALAARCGADADDLWSVGALGLLEAVRRYEAARGVKIETFVSHRIRGAMLDELRRMDRLPRRLRGRVGRLERAKRELGQKLGREPTREEVAAAAEIEVTAVHHLEDVSAEPARIDTVEPVAADHDLEELVVGHERATELRGAIAHLSDRYRTVLSLRYVEELTLREIATILNVSEPRVCQIHNAAVLKLRGILERG